MLAQNSLTAQMEAMQEDEQAADDRLNVIRDCSQLEELDRPTLLRLVMRIKVGEKYEFSGEIHRTSKATPNSTS